MDELLILGGLVLLAIPVALLYLLVSHGALKSKVAGLERQLRLMDASAPRRQAPVPAQVTPTDDALQAKSPDNSSEGGPWEKRESTASGLDEMEDELSSLPSVADKTASDIPGHVAPPRAFVFRRDTMAALSGWLRENWFYAIAALSLALAGVFLVQYGVEHGVLTPFWRVMSALGLGAALIAAGEVLRRRFGDDVGGHVDYLPSTFAGAGLFALFAGVLSARQLYGLIDPGTALAGLVAVAILAMVLGWFYGPLLAAVGIVGAIAAPFVVGGSSDAPEIFYYYFALVGIAGLAVDSIKRWAWISALVLIGSFGAAGLMYFQDVAATHYLVFALIMAAAATVIPLQHLTPRHAGSSLLGAFVPRALRRSLTVSVPDWPEFPTRLASGTFIAATGVAFLVSTQHGGVAEVWSSVGAIFLLYLVASIWMWRAPALVDLAIWPGLALLAVIALQVVDYGSLYADFVTPLVPEAALPKSASVFVVLGLVGSMLAFWRSGFSDRMPVAWGAGAALFAPLVVVALEFSWSPSVVLGADNWALHAIVVAAAMVLFAERTRRADGAHALLRTALFAMAALSMISLALMLMLSSVALTLALALVVLLAALIDARFDLRAMTVFIQIGAVVIGWRLLVDPGVYWATRSAALWEVLLGYGGSIALLGATWAILRKRGRTGAIVVVESAVWTAGGLFASVLLDRALGGSRDSHWGIALFSLVWLISMVNQLYRLQSGGAMRWPRRVLAAIFGLIGLAGLGAMATLANPLLNYGEVVKGPVVFDSLMVAYVPLAILFGVAAWKLAYLGRRVQRGFGVLSALFVAAYIGMEIRRLWQGPVLAAPGVAEGELYSYTIAMLVVSVALLFVAFSRRSVGLRKLAIIGIGLTIAKVFLIDMSGLAGLIRVASFLGLGLSLAGLAWVNRWMNDQWDKGPIRVAKPDQPS